MTELPQPGPAARREAKNRAEPFAQIILLRHGEPDWSPGGGGAVNDPGLTPYGAAQARAAAAAVAEHRLDSIYVSSYRRAQETAAPLHAATGLEPIVTPSLAEIRIHVDGLSQEKVDAYFVEASKRPLDQHWEGWPGGESFLDFHARITEGMTDVLAKHGIRPERKDEFTVWHLPPERQSIAIVAHGGTNAVLLTYLLDVTPVPWEWMRFESELAAFSILQARPLGDGDFLWSLVNFNEIDPLRNAGLR